jgi:hypothetical protein
MILTVDINDPKSLLAAREKALKQAKQHERNRALLDALPALVERVEALEAQVAKLTPAKAASSKA